MELKITNLRVINFYKENPNINFETMSIIMVDILEKLSIDIDKTINTGLQSQILSGVNDLTYRFASFSNLSNDIELKMLNIKKEYIQDMKDALVGSVNLSNDRLNINMKENNDLLLLKTQNILLDVIPKTNEVFYKDLNRNILCLEGEFKTMGEEFKKQSKNGVNFDKLNIFLSSFDNKYNTMFSNIQTFTTGFTTGFSDMQLRIVDTKNEYIREMQSILSNESNSKTEKLTSSIQQNNEILILKVKEWLSETKNSNNDEVKILLTTFEKTLHDDSIKLIELSKNENINNFILSFDDKVSKLFDTNIQTPIKLRINSTEENIERKIEALKDNKTSQDKILSELEKFLNQYNKGSSYHIGEVGENRLETILGHIYSSAIIKNTTATPHSGDFIVKRNGFKDIMIETKEWKTTLDQNEVNKFTADMKNVKLNSIFLSHTSGVAGKNNFQIDYEEECICVYIHYCEYNADKIKLAFDVIDSLDFKIDSLKKIYNFDEEVNAEDERQVIISKEILTSINNEFKKFIDEREGIITELNKNNKSIIERIKRLTFDNLKEYLSSIYAETAIEYISCSFCGEFKRDKTIIRANQSVKKHEFNCYKNPKKNSNKIVINDVIENEFVINDVIENEIVSNAEIEVFIGNNNTINTLKKEKKEKKIKEKNK